MDCPLILEQATGNGEQALPLEHYDSLAAWRQHLDGNGERYRCRSRFEQALAALQGDDPWIGWCGLCEGPTQFALPSIAAGAATNLREELVCLHCGTNSRVRAALQVVKANVDVRNADIYITEQATPTFVWLQRDFGRVVGSEYAQDFDARERMQQYLADLGGTGALRCEDVTSLSFDDASLDVIASFDVLEHVPDHARALQEFARTLRPGGMLVLTAPFVSNRAETQVRARIDELGAIEHLPPPLYHGDPLGEGRILCFYHFGWDLLDVARAAGFSEVRMAVPWVPGMGLMGLLWTLVAIR